MTKRNVLGGAAVVLLTLAYVATSGQAQQTTQTMTTYICREATSAEKPTAAMIDKSVSLVCRPFSVALRMSDGSLKTIGHVSAKPVQGPDLSKALTPAQFNAAYANWYMSAFNIPPATGG